MTDFVAMSEDMTSSSIPQPLQFTPPVSTDAPNLTISPNLTMVSENRADGDDKAGEEAMRLREQIMSNNLTNTFSAVDVDSLPQRHLLKIDIPSKKNQDRGRHWVLEAGGGQGSVGVYAVADGHGRRGDSLAESVMCILHESLTGDSSGGETGVWTTEDLTQPLQELFRKIEQECTTLFGDCDGGATLSVCVDRPGMDLWVAHVGDSDVCLVELAPADRQATMLTEDHSPLNMDEFLRMVVLCPSAKFEYDRQRKDAPHLQIYSPSPLEPCGWKRNPAPTRNVYYKNRANDLATYVSEGGGYSSLANTRAIGDFRMKRAVGLSAQPFIARHPALASSQRLVMASDGFWDSWPTAELLQFCEEHRAFGAVVAALERTHVTTTNKYFGSCSDDTFVYLVQPAEPALPTC